MGSTMTSVLQSSWSWSCCIEWQPLPDASVLRDCACPFCTKEEGRTLRRLAPAWHLRSSLLASRAPCEVPCLDPSASSRARLMRLLLRKLPVVRPARHGPSRGTSACLHQDVPCWVPFLPRRRPQACKSGDPRSQNAHSSPHAQGAPGLGPAER